MAALFTASFLVKSAIFLEESYGVNFENKFLLIDCLDVCGWRLGEDKLSPLGDALDIQNRDDGVVTIGDFRLLDSNGGGETNKVEQVDR